MKSREETSFGMKLAAVTIGTVVMSVFTAILIAVGKSINIAGIFQLTVIAALLAEAFVTDSITDTRLDVIVSAVSAIIWQLLIGQIPKMPESVRQIIFDANITSCHDKGYIGVIMSFVTTTLVAAFHQSPDDTKREEMHPVVAVPFGTCVAIIVAGILVYTGKYSGFGITVQLAILAAYVVERCTIDSIRYFLMDCLVAVVCSGITAWFFGVEPMEIPDRPLYGAILAAFLTSIFAAGLNDWTFKKIIEKRKKKKAAKKSADEAES